MRTSAALQPPEWPIWAGAVVALCVGAALRLVFPYDIEFKGDEAWIFEHVSAILAGAPWPWHGMVMSVGPPNPAMSLWILAALGHATGAHVPPDLAQGVQLLNVAALVAFLAFIALGVVPNEREPWLWAASLWALNPVEIIVARKIWQSSVLPFPTVCFIAAWWCRHWRGGGVALGIAGAILAQVHLAAMFFVIALIVWSLLYEGRAFPWVQWLCGSAIGALPALPWFIDMLSYHGDVALRLHVPVPGVFLYWPVMPYGLDIASRLGWLDLAEYLAGPVIAGWHTFGMAVVFVALAALAGLVIKHAVIELRANSAQASWRHVLVGDDCATVLINAAFWGFGTLLMLVNVIGPPPHRHYLICIVPVVALWMARTVLTSGIVRKRALLTAVCSLQAVAAVGLLVFIHQTQVIRGDFGATWRSQQPGFAMPPPQRLWPW